MTSRGTGEFWRFYGQLSPDIKAVARSSYRKFLQSPAHPSLHLERLRADPRFWSVRVSRDYRAVAQRLHEDAWVWVWIGPHKEFDRRFKA